MNIAEVLSEKAKQMGNSVALYEPRRGRERSITFAQLEERVAKFAVLLGEYDLFPGDSVLILQGLSIKLYVALIAVLRCGLTAVFLDPSAGISHVRACCALQKPKALIGPAKAHYLGSLIADLRAIKARFVTSGWFPWATRFAELENHPLIDSIYPASDEHPALLTFTSGTTGQPKAAIRSHGFLLAQHKVLARNLDLRPGQVDLSTLPIFVLANLGSGVTSILPDADMRHPGKVRADKIVAQAQRLKATRSAGSPAFYEKLLEFSGPLPEMKVYTGGGPVSPRLLTRLKERFGKDPEAVFGSTEAEPIAHLPFAQLLPSDEEAMRSGRGLLNGQPVEEIQVRILKDQWGTPLDTLSEKQFQLFQMPSGQPGEIVVQGEHVMTTYLHGKGNEETKIKVGDLVWHRTGDIGYFDDNGRLWLLGRCIAKIVDAKGVLYPFAVECAAGYFEWIRLAGCVAVRGRRWLALQVNHPPTEPAMADLRKAIAWAHLDGIKILPELPVDKRHNAKIDYAKLRELVETIVNLS